MWKYFKREREKILTFACQSDLKKLNHFALESLKYKPRIVAANLQTYQARFRPNLKFDS